MTVDGGARVWTRRELEEAVLLDKPEGKIFFKTRITATFLLQLMEWVSARRGQSVEMVVAEAQSDPLEVELKFYWSDVARAQDEAAHDRYVTGDSDLTEVEELEVENAVLTARLSERSQRLAFLEARLHVVEQPAWDEGSHAVVPMYPFVCTCGWKGVTFKDVLDPEHVAGMDL